MACAAATPSGMRLNDMLCMVWRCLNICVAGCYKQNNAAAAPPRFCLRGLAAAVSVACSNAPGWWMVPNMLFTISASEGGKHINAAL